jgi:H/ACA ribonucleoprotein complex subunit 4
LAESRDRRTASLEIVSRTGECAGVEIAGRTIEDLLSASFVIIDKPSGPTSHDVVDAMRRILRLRRVGHTGTLDPKVTGVLPIAIGRATRLAGMLLSAGKEYAAEMLVHSDAPEEKVREVIDGLVGTIEQVPPVKSRVKRVPRKREIYEIEILSIEKRRVTFRVSCQGGTYIRKLIHDAGQTLGTGAHMSKLHRTRAGPFRESECFTLEDVETAFHAHESGDSEPLPWKTRSRTCRKYGPRTTCFHTSQPARTSTSPA